MRMYNIYHGFLIMATASTFLVTATRDLLEPRRSIPWRSSYIYMCTVYLYAVISLLASVFSFVSVALYSLSHFDLYIYASLALHICTSITYVSIYLYIYIPISTSKFVFICRIPICISMFLFIPTPILISISTTVSIFMLINK